MNKINSNFAAQTIFVGMDIHKSSWNLGIHLNDMFTKNVHQKPNPITMANYLKQHYPGAHYQCYAVVILTYNQLRVITLLTYRTSLRTALHRILLLWAGLHLVLIFILMKVSYCQIVSVRVSK